MKRIHKVILLIPLVVAFYLIVRHIGTENQQIMHVKNSYSILVLVNRENKVAQNYVPEDLTVLKVRFAPSITAEEKMMKKEAARALEELFSTAQKNNINLYCVSAYRSYGLQKSIYEKRVIKVGKENTDKYVAYPGQSEHQTGLAVDVTNEKGSRNELISDFGQTKEGKWLKENAHSFGYIIRYPEGKENITGYSYEPWHIRYVGVKNSKEIKNKNIVLEEFISK